jgi:transposase
MTVKITRHDLDASGLRVEASRTSDGKVARRLLALAFVLEGHSRKEAAQSCGMDRQTLRDWVIGYNEHGLAGLSDRPHAGGPPAKLTAEEKLQVAAWVRRGPEPEEGLVRWRLCDLRRRIRDRFFVLMDERSVSRLLKEMKFSHVSVRPRHPKADPAAQEAHKKTSANSLRIRFRPKPVTGRSSFGGRMKPGSASRAV